ncbi:MAG: zf-HC2 domain-containing protein [Candidatus Omnitrophica bacterium]|nr:zf-HC2 domain-containing protein [Candidatus Omnitrophota bacterium]MCM8803297.1 zf-HC2 domain-containing protein [Candidatus Omnitrophota bacterium]
MNCRKIIKLISDYIDREIEEVKREMIEEHIKICKKCESILNTTEKTIKLSKVIYKNKKVPKRLEKILYYQIRIRYKK